MIEKVVLVKPPERSSFNFGTFSLAVLAASVRGCVDVSILDATELSVDEAVAAVSVHRPDLIGVTTMSWASVPAVAGFVRSLHRWRNSLEENDRRPLFITGGHGASIAPRSLLKAGADAAVIGEGERAFQEIVEYGIQAGRPGVVCRDQEGHIVAGPKRAPVRPLDRLPMPARDLIPPPPDGVHLMETSRGCPHLCAFCETTRFYGRQWRPYSPERVVAEVQTLMDVYDATIILLADDNFCASPRRVLRICELLQGKDLPALFMVSARADDLVADPELLPAMAAARMLRVCVGVETLNPDMALAAGKPISGETYRAAFQRLRELGMFGIASLIVGLPGETARVRRCAVEQAVSAGPDAAQFVAFQAFPGTPMGEGRSSCEPDPADVDDALRFTADFYQHPAVRGRLSKAAAEEGIRGTLARGVLAKTNRDVSEQHRRCGDVQQTSL